MIRSIDEVYQLIKEEAPKKVAVAQAADAHVLHAIEGAHSEGYADAILIGSAEKIKKIAAEEGIDLTPYEIVDVEDEQQAAATAVTKQRIWS